MSLLSSTSRWLGAFMFGVVMAATVHAQGNLEIDTPAIAALQQSMQKRHAQLEPLYAAGAVGLAVAAYAGSVIGMIAICVATAGIYAALGPFWTLPPAFLRGAAAAA